MMIGGRQLRIVCKCGQSARESFLACTSHHIILSAVFSVELNGRDGIICMH